MPTMVQITSNAVQRTSAHASRRLTTPEETIADAIVQRCGRVPQLQAPNGTHETQDFADSSGAQGLPRLQS